MFADFLLDFVDAVYEDKLLLADGDGIASRLDLKSIFQAAGFEFCDARGFDFHKKLDNTKTAVLANPRDSSAFFPAGFFFGFTVKDISFGELFPNLNAAVLYEDKSLDLDLLASAYPGNFRDLAYDREGTRGFIRREVYGRDNVAKYLAAFLPRVRATAEKAVNYREWLTIAADKAKIDSLAALNRLPAKEFDTTEINRLFQDYVLKKFGTLSGDFAEDTPVLLSRAMEHIKMRSGKFAVIVMDGMSESDWFVLSPSFKNFNYEKLSAFAMIPTTTSVSRQCLLSGKFPVELDSPWNQGKEKSEFLKCAGRLGFKDGQIAYLRGYDEQIPLPVRCAAIIINDIDDIMHGQRQGREGMARDVRALAEGGRLAALVKKLLGRGFDVHITSDHGNTPCTGLGKLTGAGVEVQTRSRRMVVLKGFADTDKLREKYDLTECPKHFLPQGYSYYFCQPGSSFDAKGEETMTHGGLALDEVVVPFITLKAGENYG